MNNLYKCWIIGWNNEDDPWLKDASDAQEAAEEVAKEYWTDDPCNMFEIEVYVQHPNGTIDIWEVKLEPVMEFHGHKKNDNLVY